MVPADAVPQAKTSLIITVQLAAAGGATLMGVLLSGSTNWSLNFGILAAVAAVAGLIGVLLGQGRQGGGVASTDE
ncbi:hypothetical protein [Williamsia sp. 1135]|uniref:hypothetical protein n=1 Tax=Williamsia sp. 1135 TaxID=1889262 RepID=UPI001180A7F8|nr:hypothetical protein [Williamsia sp. 1135]